MWLVSLFSELGFKSRHTPIIWGDNMAAKSIAENPVFHSCTKHFEIDLHFIREKVEKRDMEIRYVPTSNQLADVFTKSLPKNRFQLLCDNLGLRISPAQAAQSPTSEVQSLVNREFILRGNVGDHVT